MFTLVIGLGVLPVILDLVLLFFLIGITESEAFYGLPVALIATFATLYYAFGVNPLPFISANIPLIVCGSIVYLAIGIIWSIFSWFLYTRSMSDKVEEAWDKFKAISANEHRTIESLKSEFLNSHYYNPLHRSGVSLSNDNNWKIANWIVMWPISIVWKFVRAFTIDFSKLVLSIFGRLYDKISNSVTNKLN